MEAAGPPLAALLTFAWTSVLIELTPGPNMTVLALIAMRSGRRAGLAAVVGVALGLAIIGMAAGTGLGTLISQSRMLFEALRWGGVLYLLWLAWETWRQSDEAPTGVPASDAASFRDGLITNLLNPKAGLFFIGVLPAFADPARPYMPQATVLVVTYVAIATLVHTAIVVAASQAHRLLADRETSIKARRILAVLLAGVAIWLFFATGR